MLATKSPDIAYAPPPSSSRMNTESMSPLAGEMSALHDQLEGLEEENAILRASDVGLLTERNARQAATIKDLASELHKLRRGQDHTPASKDSSNRKRKLDDSQDAAGPSRGRPDDDTSIETEKTERPQEAGRDPRKKPKLGPMSRANDFVAGDARGRSDEFLALPAKRTEQDLKSQVEYLRRQNGTFFRRMQEAEKDWFADKAQIQKLLATVEAQKEALDEQVKASAARKADFLRRTKDVDPLLEDISRLSRDDPKYTERAKQFLCKAIEVMVNVASLDSFAHGLPNTKDGGKEEGIKGANRAIGRGSIDGKGKGQVLPTASDISSIYKDESVRSGQAGLPGPPLQHEERRHVSAPVPMGLANDPRVPCERKPLGELPAEMFQLEDEVARKADEEEEEAARHMEVLRMPPATWHGPVRPTSWPGAMPRTGTGAMPSTTYPSTMRPAPEPRAMLPLSGSRPLPPMTWSGPMLPTTWPGAVSPTTWPGTMRRY